MGLTIPRAMPAEAQPTWGGCWPRRAGMAAHGHGQQGALLWRLGQGVDVSQGVAAPAVQVPGAADEGSEVRDRGPGPIHWNDVGAVGGGRGQGAHPVPPGGTLGSARRWGSVGGGPPRGGSEHQRILRGTTLSRVAIHIMNMAELCMPACMRRPCLKLCAHYREDWQHEVACAGTCVGQQPDLHHPSCLLLDPSPGKPGCPQPAARAGQALM